MLMYRCDRCRRVVEVLFVAYDHRGPGLSYEYRCQPGGHLFTVGHHQVQPKRVAHRAEADGPAGA